MKTPAQPTVLLVEDDIVTAKCYKSYLPKKLINLLHVDTGEAALRYLQQATPAVILLELGLPDMNGMTILKSIHDQQLQSVVIIITAENQVDVVVEAMRYGAFDFIEKPCQADRLLVRLDNALHQHNLYQSREFNQEYPQYHDLIGASKPMQAVYQIIDNVATSSAPILITGETGTGKELCAQAIYKESQRANKSFVVCNCATIPAQLQESHLFGHVKGAFTGAISTKKGFVCQADGGTLFLDEIGELPDSMQTTLLRFAQFKTFHKVGSLQLEKVDVRLICATNRDLSAEVKAGRFRKDLYYRLNAIQIKLPPLRQRGEDILLLAQFFLQQFVKEEQKDFRDFTDEAKRMLLEYEWPGNVRELQNLIHRLVLFNKGQLITAKMLTALIGKEVNDNPSTPVSCHSLNVKNNVSLPRIASTSLNVIRSLEEIEKEAILKAYEYCGGNATQTANLLGISRATVFNKLRQYRITG